MRILIRRWVDHYAPVMWVELPDGRGVSLGGPNSPKLRDVRWTQKVFAEVAAGEKFPEWELVET